MPLFWKWPCRTGTAVGVMEVRHRELWPGIKRVVCRETDRSRRIPVRLFTGRKDRPLISSVAGAESRVSGGRILNHGPMHLLKFLLRITCTVTDRNLISFLFTQVYVEFDDLDWDKREWFPVHKGSHFHLFLLEESLVLAHRTSAAYAAGVSGVLHPAMVKMLLLFKIMASALANKFEPKVVVKCVLKQAQSPNLSIFQTFKPLVDTVGLYSRSKQKQPVEFMGDLKLDFQDTSKLRVIRVSVCLCTTLQSGPKVTPSFSSVSFTSGLGPFHPRPEPEPRVRVQSPRMVGPPGRPTHLVDDAAGHDRVKDKGTADESIYRMPPSIPTFSTHRSIVSRARPSGSRQ